MAKSIICEHCHSTDGVKTHTPRWAWGMFVASCVLLLVLWPLAVVLFIIAACVGEKRCRTCSEVTKGVPTDSPRGEKLMAERPKQSKPAA